MVMCPCVDGLSHNEAEDISPEWAAAGCDVLFHAVLETGWRSWSEGGGRSQIRSCRGGACISHHCRLER